jgi:hypothetical protein
MDHQLHKCNKFKEFQKLTARTADSGGGTRSDMTEIAGRTNIWLSNGAQKGLAVPAHRGESARAGIVQYGTSTLAFCPRDEVVL